MANDNGSRRFVSPSGRQWTARLYTVSDSPHELSPTAVGSSPARVLRFESGDITLDLVDWPGDWVDRSDDELVRLARSAQPPAYGPPRTERA